MILLMQSYNNEELIVSRDLSASDQNILEIFKGRAQRISAGRASAHTRRRFAVVVGGRE
jgi:hypothetical protein